MNDPLHKPTMPEGYCPDCEAGDCRSLGQLPPSQHFAEKRLSDPLPESSLYQCNICALKFRSPLLSQLEYERLYNTESAEAWRPQTIRRDQEIVRTYIADRYASASVLDVGCHAGYFLQCIGPSYQRYGIEINEAAAARARLTADAIVWPSLDEIPAQQRFDVIVAMDVIEHFASPRDFIARLLPLLSDRGQILLTTGDAEARLWSWTKARWWYCRFPEHIAFISRSWLSYQSKKLGFEALQVRVFNYVDISALALLKKLAGFGLYAVLPGMYLKIKQLLGHGDSILDLQSVPGAGISEDHLFVAIRRIDAQM
jgi:SAM-dependent methyltransferase